MKIQETFYTLSSSELKKLCKRYAMKGFAKDDANTEFEMTAKLVTIENNIANVLSNENNTWYACLLTKRGIKKNS